ncbi:MAG: AMP-binding protein [Actinomycetota bacterium]|nr:AMP-binding protein [Actinomycetota bacterium]
MSGGSAMTPTLVDVVRQQALDRADAPFLAFAEGGDLTFGQFDEATDRVATALAELGVNEGDRVLGLLTNSRAFMVLMIAVHKRRAIFVPINTELKGSFLEHQVHNSEPRLVAVDVELLDQFALVDTSGVGIETTIVVGATGDGPELPSSLSATRSVRYDDLEAVEVRADAVLTPTPQDVCTIMYTSGTTGPSKGVLMPQAHCYLFGLGTVQAMSLIPDDHYYVCMPMFHANGLFMQAYACLVAGCSATVVKRFSVSNWLDDVIACGATATNALGVMPEFIFRSPASDRDRGHRLTRVMAIPVAEDWAEAFEERFGVDIVQGFGMTEINMVAFSRTSEPVEAGCAGYVLDEHFEVVIADPETDEMLDVGRVGEILVRPRSPFCFNVGYFKMPDKTVEAWRNLWFHTGDAGRFDELGRLHFVDRIKDRIRRRGENISSYEVEQVLNAHPAVLESAAVGIRVEGAGGEEEIKAVLAVSGEPPDLVELLDWCVERMPRFTVPRYFEFVDELDKTASGKIRKQALRDSGVTASTLDRETIGYVIARRA